jgi:hypothetical protein
MKYKIFIAKTWHRNEPSTQGDSITVTETYRGTKEAIDKLQEVFKKELGDFVGYDAELDLKE